MWPDNETERDFLNFSGVADTVAEIIVQAQGRPISLGVSGAWGTGKSSMIKLIQTSLRNAQEREEVRDFVFVEFNAWLYQGYDDARAALMDVIADRLHAIAEDRKTGVDKAKDLLKRVRWLRVAKLAGTAAAGIATIAFGVPPVGLVGDVFKLGQQMAERDVDSKTVKDVKKELGDVAHDATGLLAPKAEESPPKEIQALRDAFEETLALLDVTLVVLIDDLDRCLPETTISTLEAIRLFLFLKNTAFVIAADNAMIKYAVRRHFEGVDDDQLITSYFDKLIQVPILVPPLGTQEVRAYLMLLFAENSTLSEDTMERIRKAICGQLQRVWQGKRVDRAFVQSLGEALPEPLIAKFDTAERLAPIMATASGISGNPRMIKRFLNALGIRMAISNAQGVGVDEAVLAKLLLFERLATPAAYAELTAAITGSDDGIPKFLAVWEHAANTGADLELHAPWDTPFIREWLTLPPTFAERDLRGAIYVGREHAPVSSPGDRLSSEAVELLTALLDHPEMSAHLGERLSRITKPELTLIMDRLLDRARNEQEWGAPPILEACLIVADGDAVQAARLSAFLQERPPAQIRASIVPKISDRNWADGVFEFWAKSDVSTPVKAAIRGRLR